MESAQTFSTPFLSGASQVICEPSGEIWGRALSGFPKRTSRGMSAGNSARAQPAETRTRARAANLLIAEKVDPNLTHSHHRETIFIQSSSIGVISPAAPKIFAIRHSCKGRLARFGQRISTMKLMQL